MDELKDTIHLRYWNKKLNKQVIEPQKLRDIQSRITELNNEGIYEISLSPIFDDYDAARQTPLEIENFDRICREVFEKAEFEKKHKEVFKDDRPNV